MKKSTINKNTIKKTDIIRLENDILYKTILSDDLDYVFEIICKHIEKIYGFEGAFLSFISSDGNKLKIEKIRLPDNLNKSPDKYLGKTYLLNRNPQSVFVKCIKQEKFLYFENFEDYLDKDFLEELSVKSVLSVPVLINHACIGSVTLTSHKANIKLKQTEIGSIKRFLRQIAGIVRNLRTMQELKKKNAEIQTINEIANKMSRSLDFDEIFDMIFKYLVEAYGFEGCGLSIVTPDRKNYVAEKYSLPEFLSDIEEYVLGRVLPLNLEKGGRAAECILKNEVFYFSGVNPGEITDELNRKVVETLKIKTALHIPFSSENEVIGEFLLTSHSKQIYLSQEDIDSIKRFVNQIGFALRNSKLYKEIKSKKEEIEHLNAITNQMNSSLDFDEIFDMIFKYLVETYGFEGCGLSIVTPDRKNYVAEKYSLPEFLSDIEEYVLGRVFPLNLEMGGRAAECILKNEVFYFSGVNPEEITDELNRKVVETLKIKTALHIPFSSENEVIGEFLLTSHSEPIYLSDEDLDSIKRFVNQIASIVRNSKLYQEIKKERAFSKSLLENSPFAIQVIDKNDEIIYINPACEIVSGFDNKEVIRKHYLSFNSIKNTGLDKAYKDAKNGKTVFIDNLLFKSDITKKEQILNLVYTPVLGTDKNVENVLVMYYDNTEKAKTDRMIKEDLYMAKKIQTSVISKALDIDDEIDISVSFKPMMQVGGDIYDIYKVKPGYYRIFIADATGHGIQAALTTMIIKTEYDKIKIISGLPHLVLALFNNLFTEKYSNLNVFFTCMIIDINLNKNIISYSSAGHPDQYIVEKQKLKRLNAGGKMIGLLHDTDYELKQNDFLPHDKILLFTDGLFEQFSKAGEEYGENKLEKLISQNKNKPIRELMDNVILEIEKWCGTTDKSDDITFIVIKNLNMDA